MNKLFTKIAAVVLGATMAVGVGVAVVNREARQVNADGVEYKLTIIDSNITAEGSATSGYGKYNGTRTLQAVGTSDSSLTYDVDITTSQVMPNSSKIQFQANAGKLFNETPIGTIKSISNGNSVLTNTYGDSVEPTGTTVGGSYFKIAKTSKSAASSEKIEIVFEITASTKTATTTSITLPQGRTSTLDLVSSSTNTIDLDASVTYTGGSISSPTIAWSSGTPSVATVDESTGLVTAVGKGQTEISASYAGDDTYNSSIGKLTISVINSNDTDFVFATLASENNWQNDTKYEPTVDGVTITTSDASNGKYYTSDKTWRMYKDGSLTITPPSNKVISAVSSNPSYSFTIEDDGTATASFSATTKFNSIIVNLAEPPSEYTVTFDSDGGSAVTSQQVTRGNAIGTLPTSTKADYYLLGWKLSTAATESDPFITSAYVPNKNVTLKAIWTSDTLYVTYTATGATSGAAPTDSTVYHYNGEATVLGQNTMAKAHHTFNGWNTAADGTGTAYAAGAKITMTEDVTLYAQWTVNNVTKIEIVNESVPTKTTYEGGEHFDPTGLIVWATYENEGTEEVNIADELTWSPDPLTEGTTSVTGTYKTSGKSVTVNGLTVTAAPGTEDNPFTVDEAIEFIDSLSGETSSEKVYVKGIVSSSTAGTTDTTGNYRDVYLYDGSDNAGVLELYRAYLDNHITGISDEANSMVYYEVVGCGYAKYYSSGNQYELCSKKIGTEYDNCYVTSATESSVTTVNASIKTGTYLTGHKLSTSDFTVTANYNHGKPSETITSDFTWTINGVLDGTLSEGNNAVIVTYDNVASASFNVVGTTTHATGITIDETLSLFVEDQKSIGYSVEPADCSDTITWAVTAASPSGCITVDQTGKVTGVAEGTATVTATVYGYSDTCSVTVSPLQDPSLVVSTGSGKTSYKFGESLDTTGWSAIYTDGKGVSTDVISSLDFGSLNFIGTKSLTATYLGTTSNGVNITVTNNGATCDDVDLLDSEGFSYSNMPTGWSHSGASSSDYGSSHTPYNLKLDGTGDKVFASINTSATKIIVELGVKMIGGANTSKFVVNAYSSADTSDLGDPISTIESKELTISGAQNDIVTPSATLINNEGATVRTIEFSFVKGSNVGVGTGKITVNDIDAFAPNQANAWAQYFVDEIGGLCDAGGNTSAANVQAIKDKWSTLANEYGWMLGESKDYFAEHTSDATIARVIGMYTRIVERYGQTNFIVDGSNNKVVNASQVNPVVINSDSTNAVAIVVIISVVSLTAIGGYFFLRKRREQ